MANNTFSHLKSLHQRQNNTLEQLSRSLRIAEIRKDIFKAGSVTLKMTGAYDHHPTKGQQIIRAHLVDGDGVIYPLSRNELALIRPDLVIHHDYN